MLTLERAHMNERLKQLAEQAGVTGYFAAGTEYATPIPLSAEMEKFAELIVAECTQVLFQEAERLFELSSEETNLHQSDNFEISAEQCMDNIAMLEQHFEVE
jgi:hypothetical protein